MLALLLVDRQIFHEAVPIFYSRRCFCIGFKAYDAYDFQFIRDIGQRRLDLIRTIRYSVKIFNAYRWVSFGQWYQSFRCPEQTEWHEIFGYLRLACGLQTLEIDLVMTPTEQLSPSPKEWEELESCLIGIKGRMDLVVFYHCFVHVRDYPAECQGMTTRIALRTNRWTCEKGQTEWGPMKSMYRTLDPTKSPDKAPGF